VVGGKGERLVLHAEASRGILACTVRASALHLPHLLLADDHAAEPHRKEAACQSAAP
jgi:hypothetical protein